MVFTGKPEATVYRDTGCEAHPACLTCPFERCLLDEGEADRPTDERLMELAQRIEALKRDGLTANEIARELGVTRRTVFRRLQRAREATR